MRPGRAVLVLVALLATACPGSDERSAAEELSELVAGGDTVSYQATYAYEVSGPTREAVRTEMKIVQDPPSTLRMLSTTTQTGTGEAITNTSWIIQRPDGSFACYETGEGVRCQPTDQPTTLFDLRPVDEMFERARNPEGLEEVEQLRAVTIAGAKGTCYRAIPEGTPEATGSPAPNFVADEARYELCYTSDGILLRARRTLSGESPEGDRTVSFTVQATSLSRTVQPTDLELPGPLVEPGSA